MTMKELKELRTALKLTQKEMAELIGIHPNAYQKFEYGTTPIPKYISNFCEWISKYHEFLNI